MITTETHDHALTCEITQGRGCDCGLTGMAGVAFYVSGEPVYKEPALRQKRGAISIEGIDAFTGEMLQYHLTSKPLFRYPWIERSKNLSATNEILERILKSLTKKPDA